MDKLNGMLIRSIKINAHYLLLVVGVEAGTECYQAIDTRRPTNRLWHRTKFKREVHRLLDSGEIVELLDTDTQDCQELPGQGDAWSGGFAENH